MDKRASEPPPPRIRTYDVSDGIAVPDVSTLLTVESAVARKHELQALLGATRNDPTRAAERDALRAEDAAVSKRIGELREAQKLEHARRSFAGLGSPLHEAIVQRFDAQIVAELELEALARQTERERRAAERKAQKAAGKAQSQSGNAAKSPAKST